MMLEETAQESRIRDRRDYEPCAGHRREHGDFFFAQRAGPARSPGASSRTTPPLRRAKRRRNLCGLVAAPVRANQRGPEGVLFDLRMAGRQAFHSGNQWRSIQKQHLGRYGKLLPGTGWDPGVRPSHWTRRRPESSLADAGSTPGLQFLATSFLAFFSFNKNQ